VAKVERAAVAVLLKHNQLINEAMTFALWLTNNPSALEVADKAPLPPSLQMVWEVAYEVRSWLVQQQHKRRLAHKEGDAEIRFRLPQPRLIPLTVPHSKGFSLTCVCGSRFFWLSAQARCTSKCAAPCSRRSNSS
jgi:hypothetical protein